MPAGWAMAAAAVVGAIEAQKSAGSASSTKNEGGTKPKSPMEKKEYSSTYEADFTPPVFSTTYFPESSSTFDSSSSSSSNDYIGGGGSFDGGGASGDF